MPQAADRNLLFVVLALQHDLVRRGPLLHGLAQWSQAKHRPVADVLVQEGALAAEDRKVVDALLEAHGPAADLGLAPAGPFGEGPALRRLVEDADPGGLLGALADSSLETQALNGAAPPAAARGFEVLGELGRGGMGVVYRARDLALGREVAVKVLQDKYDPDSAAALRFLEEARITGQLQHPGVPAVYQMGALANGRPYLAMKLIKGETLDQLLVAKAPVDAPAVFEAICQAVGYAHAHGVVHRDLKPSNVMVGPFGEVQVMDWGLAKVLDHPASPRDRGADDDPEATTAPTEIRPARNSDTPFTLHGSVLGTPSFMAPEQAAGETDKLGPAADVFGLGAILCVMLTGRPPFTGKDQDSVRVAAVRGDTAAAFRRLDECGADGDLVALCKRCLAFDSAARPADANEVAAAVSTLRQAAEERLHKAEQERRAAEVQVAEQSKRRRALQWSAAAVALVLLLGVAGTSAGMLQARAAQQKEADERGKAVEAKEQAEKRLTQIEKGVELLAGVIGDLDPMGERKGEPPLHEQFLARARKAADELQDEAIGDPIVVARLRVTLGRTLLGLGDRERAEAILNAARETLERGLGSEHPETLRALSALASAYVRTFSRLSEASQMFERVADGYRAARGEEDPQTLWAKYNLASSYVDAGRLGEAIEILERVRDARVNKAGEDHPDNLEVLTSLARAYFASGRRKEAVSLLEQARERVTTASGEENVRSYQVKNQLAAAYVSVGREAEALGLFEALATAGMRRFGPDHPFTLASRHNVACAYAALGRFDEALKLLEEVRGRTARAGGLYEADLATVNYSLAVTLAKAKRFPEAVSRLEELRPSLEATLGADHPKVLTIHAHLIEALAGSRRWADALELFEKVRGPWTAKLGPDHPDLLHAEVTAANALMEVGDREGGIRRLEAVCDRVSAAFGECHQETHRAFNNLAVAYFNEERYDAAIRIYEELLRRWEKGFGRRNAQTPWIIANLATNYMHAGRAKEAVTLLTDTLEGVSDAKLKARVGTCLADAYLYAGDREKAVSLARSMAAEIRGFDGIERLVPLGGLAATLVRAHAYAEAEHLLREVLEAREKETPDDWMTYLGKARLGVALHGQGKHAQAEPLLLAGLAGLKAREKQIRGRDRRPIAEMAERLAELYEATRKPDLAAKWRSEAAALKAAPNAPPK